MNDGDEDWDLSALLKTMAPPGRALERLRRRARRRRQQRLTLGAVVVGLVSAAVGFAATSGGTPRSQQVVVSSPPTTPAIVLLPKISQEMAPPAVSRPAPPPTTAAPTTAAPTTAAPAAPVIPPAPASAARGAVPFDLGDLRLWLPPSWISAGSTCTPPGVAEGGVTFFFAPCAGSGSTAGTAGTSLSVGPVGSPPAGGQTTTVNGLDVEESGASTETWYFPQLGVGLTATGPSALAVAATAQESAGEVVDGAAATLPSAVPVGWKPITFEGLTFSVPSAWPVEDPPSDGCGTPGTSGAVELGNPPAGASCPPRPWGPEPAKGGVSVTVGAGLHAFSPPATDLRRAVTADGVHVELGVVSGYQNEIWGDVTFGKTELTVAIGVASDPAIAWHILGSMAPTASASATPSTCGPDFGSVPMPVISTLTTALQPPGTLLEPPPPGAVPTESAAQAWSGAGVQGPAGAHYFMFLARYSAPAAGGTLPPDAGARGDLAWVIYAQGVQSPNGRSCTTDDEMWVIDFTGNNRNFSNFAPYAFPPGALVTPGR